MNLTQEEAKVLEYIKEGINNTHQVKVFLGLELKKIKEIFAKLEKLGLIKVERKFDNYYKEDYWNAEVIERKPQ